MAKNVLWPILGCTSQIRSVVRNPYVWSALLEMFFENGNDLGQSGKQSRSPRSFVKIPSQSFPLPDPRCISWATLKRNIMELNGFKLRGAGYQVYGQTVLIHSRTHLMKNPWENHPQIYHRPTTIWYSAGRMEQWKNKGQISFQEIPRVFFVELPLTHFVCFKSSLIPLYHPIPSKTIESSMGSAENWYPRARYNGLFLFSRLFDGHTWWSTGPRIPF